MKIGFFLENNKAGGLDTFVINLLNYWPYRNDKLILFVNSNHPGLKNLRVLLNKNIKIKPYANIIGKLNYNKLVKNILKFYYFKKNLNYIYKILKKSGAQRLLMIQGGYPGGQTSMAAVSAWNIISNYKPWFNFHNYVTPKIKIDLFRQFIDYNMKKKIKGFISVSKDCIKSIYPELIFRDKKKHFIYNGIKINSVKKKTIKKSRINLLMLGVYEKRKGHSFLFEALKYLSKKKIDFQCSIYGDGNRDEINIVYDQIPLDIKSKIKLYKHKNKINPIILDSDIVVVPSQNLESFGYAALEAMVLKKPVISTNCGGLPEVVKNNYNGFVVNKKNYKEFAKKIYLLSNNKKLRLKMGQNGYERYLELFQAKDMSRKYSDLIKND